MSELTVLDHLEDMKNSILERTNRSREMRADHACLMVRKFRTIAPECQSQEERAKLEIIWNAMFTVLLDAEPPSLESWRVKYGIL